MMTKRKKIICFLAVAVLLVLIIMHFTAGLIKIGSGYYTPRYFFSDKKTLALALALAVERGGDAKKINRLIQEGADVNAVGKKGTPLLGWAVVTSKGDYSAVEQLLDYGADPNYISPKNTALYGSSTMYMTASSPRAPLLRMLLKHGGNPNIRNPAEDNRTVLMAAAYNGELENVKLLLKHGAKLNARDDAGMSALFYSLSEGQYRVTYYLLNQGADYRLIGKPYSGIDNESFLQTLSNSRNLGFNQEFMYWRCKVLTWFKKRNIKLPKMTYRNEFELKQSRNVMCDS